LVSVNFRIDRDSNELIVRVIGGEDDDGFVLYLKKMNLELFKSKLAEPSDSWWERLFTAHGEIQFDDYDKDFTDLPAPIAEVRGNISTFTTSVTHSCSVICRAFARAKRSKT
jgi:hypothetical protein